jgi:hypothetical protein
MTHDDRGKGKLSKGGFSLTDYDFLMMAKTWGMSVEEVKKNVFSQLKKEFKE